MRRRKVTRNAKNPQCGPRRRLVLRIDGRSDRTLVQGDGGNDKLFLIGAETFTFTDTSFKSIEAVYVREALTLDLSGVTTGTTIVLQNVDDTSATVAGTKGNDIIKAGEGSADINGGTGSDKLYAGSGGRYLHVPSEFRARQRLWLREGLQPSRRIGPRQPL
ncbi:hypothetical protein FPV16_08250 [Methylobacterium sp. W2]|uniref:hypothetical protein n=1 Tax=Methylobacterium sp. W2 TaxID=2598107 RepID=UPI001D0CCBE3|nr:hypothetical protein [Methylobacterium sp. W2]MCC0806202.1 hypothetical protein [Methylobacterium sp. W2]